MRVLTAIGVLGLLIHGSSTALPGTPDASAAVTNARPGFVRHVSGNPAVLGAVHLQSEPLQAGRRLNSGEQVITRSGDRVEIVLSADSYLRLGGKARVEVLSDDYPVTDVRLLQGEAVVDSKGADGKHHVFSVSTPAGDLRVIRPGFYRIRVHPERPVGVTVFSGRLSWLGPRGRQSELSQRKHYSLDPLAETPSVSRMDKSEPGRLGSQLQVPMVYLCSLRFFSSFTLWIPLHQHPLDSGTRPARKNDGGASLERIPPRLRQRPVQAAHESNQFGTVTGH